MNFCNFPHQGIKTPGSEAAVIQGLKPTIMVEAANLAAGWERAVVETYFHGGSIATQYDQPDQPKSYDATTIIVVHEPFAEPRWHKCIPAGIEEMEDYVQEVCDGIHDHWIDPEDHKWQYTYHERLFSYAVPGIEKPINQIEYVIDSLCAVPHTRRAQAVLWKPWEDAGIADPACLQRMWFRIFESPLGEFLEMDIDIRSNDAYKAAFMNMFAFTELQRQVAEQISERTGHEIKVGAYTHKADSFHIYGSYFEEFKGFLESCQRRSWEQRTWHSDDPVVVESLRDARLQIPLKLQHERETGQKGVAK